MKKVAAARAAMYALVLLLNACQAPGHAPVPGSREPAPFTQHLSKKQAKAIAARLGKGKDFRGESMQLTGMAIRQSGVEFHTTEGKETCTWDEIGPVRQYRWWPYYSVATKRCGSVHFGVAAEAKAFAEALSALYHDATLPADPAEVARFETVALQYRNVRPKPALPADARKFRIQAEAAVHDKAWDEAADLYEIALELAPWWPEGRFNRALILAELKEYRDAMTEMKRYLLLVPDAPNASAAQDKIYEWEGRAKRSR